MQLHQDSAPTRLAKSAISVIKVFSATMARERERLGERISEWLAANPQLEVLDTIISHSSDSPRLGTQLVEYPPRQTAPTAEMLG